MIHTFESVPQTTLSIKTTVKALLYMSMVIYCIYTARIDGLRNPLELNVQVFNLWKINIY